MDELYPHKNFWEPLKSALLIGMLGFLMGASLSVSSRMMWDTACAFGGVSAFLAGVITWFMWMLRSVLGQPGVKAVEIEPAEEPVDDDPWFKASTGSTDIILRGLPFPTEDWIDHLFHFTTGWANGDKLTYQVWVVENREFTDAQYQEFIQWFIEWKFGVIPEGYRKTMRLTPLGVDLLNAIHTSGIQPYSPTGIGGRGEYKR